MNDQDISNALTRIVQESGDKETVIYLSPRDRMPDGAMPNLEGAQSNTKVAVWDGLPELHVEVFEAADQFHIFISKIGCQAALDAVPQAQWEGNFRLPGRIFFPGDTFKADYETARYADSYSLYSELCSGLKPKSIFEIGVRYGYSAWAMLHCCYPGTVYHGIDINSVEQAAMMLHREFPQHELRLARADSSTLTHLSRSYDLAHVDGNHSHEATLHDIGLCWGRAKYILVDDTIAFCTTNSAINEWLAKYPQGSYQAVRYNTQTGHVLMGPLPVITDGTDVSIGQTKRHIPLEIPGTVKSVAASNR
jgi:Methyltransferase domain